jgi:lipoprotein-releasing system permease protein
MRTDLFIARRLRLIAPGSRRSSVSVKTATIGVALSIVVMLLTLAIVNGFKKQITDKIIGFDSQLTITALNRSLTAEKAVTLSDTTRRLIDSALPQAKVDLAIVQPAIIKTTDDFNAAIFRAYAPGKDVSFIADNLVDGVMPNFDSPANTDSIVISRTVAKALRLSPCDKIDACFIIDQRIRVRRFNIAGIYQSNFGEYDKVVAFCPMAPLQRLLNLQPNQGTRIELNGLQMATLDYSQQLLNEALSNAFYTKRTNCYMQTTSILQSGAIYFNWLSLLDTNVLVIIILMSAISIFTLISSLFILILERVKMIGILKTMGASNSLIRRVFILLASRIVVRGLLLGNIIGLLLIAVQAIFHIVPLNPEAYYISYVPVNIGLLEILLLNATAIIVATAVMIIPSRIISRMNPADTVRFE